MICRFCKQPIQVPHCEDRYCPWCKACSDARLTRKDKP